MALTSISPLPLLLLPCLLSSFLQSLQKPVLDSFPPVPTLFLDSHFLLLIRDINARKSTAFFPGTLCEQRGTLKREWVETKCVEWGCLRARGELGGCGEETFHAIVDLGAVVQ